MDDERTQNATPEEAAARQEAGPAEGVTEQQQLEQQLEEMKNELALARADFYNYRQRAEKEKSRIRSQSAEDRSADFFPVLDNLDRALQVTDETAMKDLLMGVQMVQRQFISLFQDQGIETIPTVGTPFDPAVHEAVETEAATAPEEDGMVTGEILRGFRTPTRVLRAARVRVAKSS